MHPDEREFFKDCLYVDRYCRGLDEPYIRTVFDFYVEKGVNYKRLIGWLNKWCAKGIYEYGVSLLAGWFIESEIKKRPNYMRLAEEVGKENNYESDNRHFKNYQRIR